MNILKSKISVSLTTLIVLILLVSCGKSSQFRSPSTGWKVNDKVGGFYYNTNFKKQQIAPGLVLVEGGTFLRGKVQDDVMHEWNNEPSRQHVQTFYMDESEVTNIMYLEYLYWTKKVFSPDNEKYANVYNGILPDTLIWKSRLGYNENMTSNYLRHPAYAEYPVVGVNWIQANEYAKWRTDRYNEMILERTGFTKPDAKLNDIDPETTFDTETYICSPKSTYGGKQEITQGGKISKLMLAHGRKKNLYVQRTDGILSPEYRLPTESEWEYAASADISQRFANNLLGQKRYPWSGNYTRSSKRNRIGDQLANFKQAKGDYSNIAGWSDDGSDITNKVKSYPPNAYGLYDMAGNVAEWVADVYRPIVDDEINDFNYFRGNIFMKNKINDDGTFDIVTAETQKYDTLSNGKIIARNFPGQITRVPVDENETFLRHNFDKSNNVNYRDGDLAYSRYYNFDPKKIKPRRTDKNKDTITNLLDSLGKKIIKFDKTKGRNTIVVDKFRVYKGGSWQDRVYWLDPGQRRYMPEDMSSDFIGFRCAMSRVGSKSEHPKKNQGYKIIKYKKKFVNPL